MLEQDVIVTTKYGQMPTFAACPEGPGQYPGIIFYMDAPGFGKSCATWRGGLPGPAISASCPTCTTGSGICASMWRGATIR